MDTKQIIRYLLTEGTVEVSDSRRILPEQKTESWTYDELVHKLTTKYGDSDYYNDNVPGSSFILKDGIFVHLTCSHEAVMQDYYDKDESILVEEYNAFLKKFQLVRVFVYNNQCGITFSGKVSMEQLDEIGKLADYFELTWKDALWGSIAGDGYESLEDHLDEINLLESTNAEVLDRDGNPLEDLSGQPIVLNSDGTVTLYHYTSLENANKIKATGDWLSLENTQEVFFTNKLDSEYGKGFGKGIVKIRIDPSKTRLSDSFRNGEVHVAIKISDLR